MLAGPSSASDGNRSGSSRRLRGRVEAGKSGGGNAYGYRVVRSLTDQGVATGEREIDSEQAAVVLRIFREYASGDSPKAIARRLNGEGIEGSSGGPWIRARSTAMPIVEPES
jgi:DNA invertase Pin-like site-specific DNA recombinase